jgi:RNA polymerase primary sigma factor
MARFETSDNLPKYFKTIAKCEPLSLEQEKELAAKIKAGDSRAIHKLVQHNLKIVVTIANRHIGQGVPLDDLIQEGNIGLYEAAQRFEPREGVRFISYASLWVRKRINEAVASYGRIVRLPHNQEYDIYKAKLAGEETADLRAVAIDSQISEDNGSTIGDIILTVQPEVEFEYEMDDLRFTVRQAIGILKDRDQQILKQYFGIDLDYAVPSDIIAENFNMTNVRVCQIVKASIQKIKQSI